MSDEETWLQLARRVALLGGYRPNDTELRSMLWNETAFPFASAADVERLLRRALRDTPRWWKRLRRAT